MSMFNPAYCAPLFVKARAPLTVNLAARPLVLPGLTVLPATVNEISDNVTVEGEFGALLSLLVRLETYDRILSVSQFQLSSTATREDDTRLRATFTLSRYTTRPEPVPLSPAARGSATAATGGAG